MHLKNFLNNLKNLDIKNCKYSKHLKKYIKIFVLSVITISVALICAFSPFADINSTFYNNNNTSNETEIFQATESDAEQTDAVDNNINDNVKATAVSMADNGEEGKEDDTDNESDDDSDSDEWYCFKDIEDILDEDAQPYLEYVFNAFIDMGFTPEFACGICGNIIQESHFDAEAINEETGSFGITQWGGSRKTAFYNFARDLDKNQKNINTQLLFVKQELNNEYIDLLNNALFYYDEENGYDDIFDVDDVQTACDLWCAVYENRPCYDNHDKSECPEIKISPLDGVQYQELTKRREYSQKIYEAMYTGEKTEYDNADNGDDKFDDEWDAGWDNETYSEWEDAEIFIDSDNYSLPVNGSNNAVPYFSQDGHQPWSELAFGYEDIAHSGCSITSLAMVLSYLKDEWIYPSDVRQMIIDKHGNYNAFYEYPDGQNGLTLFPALAKDYGMHCKIFYTSSDVRKYLEDGIPVIMDCNGSDFPSYNGDTEYSYFTRQGHFVVITGIDRNGNYYINDPNVAHKDFCRHKFTLYDLKTCSSGKYFVAIYP